MKLHKNAKKNAQKAFDVLDDKIKSIHGNRYKYDNFVYLSSSDKSHVTCRLHGDFLVSMRAHLSKDEKIRTHCPKCKKIYTKRQNIKKRKDKALSDAKRLHNGYYDYSKFVFEGMSKKGIVICPEHGEFLVNMTEHTGVRRTRCRKCVDRDMGIANRNSQDDVVKRFFEVHGDKYDYSAVKYTRTCDKVDIYCKKHRVWFKQTPNGHLTGRSGCTTCAEIKMITSKLSEEHRNVKFNIYYIELNGVYKIGVTSRGLRSRYGKDVMNIAKILYWSKELDIDTAVSVEQKIVRRYSKFTYTGKPLIEKDRYVGNHKEWFCTDIFKGDYSRLQKMCNKQR